MTSPYRIRAYYIPYPGFQSSYKFRGKTLIHAINKAIVKRSGQVPYTSTRFPEVPTNTLIDDPAKYFIGILIMEPEGERERINY